jgi:hypothetical protein
VQLLRRALCRAARTGLALTLGRSQIAAVFPDGFVDDGLARIGGYHAIRTRHLGSEIEKRAGDDRKSTVSSVNARTGRISACEMAVFRNSLL